MRKNQTKKRGGEPRDWRGTSPAPLLRNDTGCIGVHADYRREDYIFPRTQSLAMRALEWESRLKPIKPWGINAVATLAWHVFA
jgi:hypothetical protein